MNMMRNKRAELQPRRQAPNALRSYERYLVLAREAASVGDEIGKENYYQHAEHFFRIIRQTEPGS